MEAAALAASVLEITQPLARKNGVRLEFAPPAGPLDMVTDRTKLRQILLNLVGNACKFTYDGTVRVSLRRTRARDRIWAEFSIADTGIGIAEDRIPDLFRDFSQVSDQPQSQREGSGLGLAISQRLAASLGGRITCESRLGEGSVFTLTVPMRVSDRPGDPGGG